MKIQTIFKVNGENYAADGSGQEAATAALNSFPNEVITLAGFLINDEFKKADLTSHWERTQLRKQ